MRTVLLSTPPGALGGNRTTALRWAQQLRTMGWTVCRTGHDSERQAASRADLILALHAVRARPEVDRWLARRPEAKLVVACTGTDIYESKDSAQPLLERADRIIVLQERALDELSAGQRRRAHVIHQSTPRRSVPQREAPEIAVIASLRAVKEPLLAAAASRLLPEESALRVVHVGPSICAELEDEVRREQATNARYEWRGNVRRSEALCLLAGARAVVLPSRSEGGANVITEAFAMGTPVLASRVPGNTGLLGEEHPGLFDAGDVQGLARLMLRLEREPRFREDLARRSAMRASLASPEREAAAWRHLLEGLGLGA
ncbi:MAG: glycosyltransferase [Planctomycetota bacterium]|nr:glycosyltransferase [Planctomycetota bacterium]MDG1984287.1 glycosyltransferase [Planctomycetota bacterium]